MADLGDGRQDLCRPMLRMPLEQGQSRVQAEFLGHFDQMVEPSVEVVADPIGPLPLTLEGCYLLVIIDRASR